MKGYNMLLIKPIITFMLCSIPSRTSIRELIGAVNSFGFANTYDLVFLPCRPQRRRLTPTNFGYAFVNFSSPEHATDGKRHPQPKIET